MLYKIINKGEGVGYIRSENAENIQTMAIEKYGQDIYTIVKISNTDTKWITVLDFSSARVEIYPLEVDADGEDVTEQVEDYLSEEHNLDEINFMVSFEKPELDIAE